MGTALLSYIAMMASVAFAAIISSMSLSSREIFKVGIAWAVVLTVAMFTHMFVLIGLVVLVAVATREKSIEFKLFYFISLLPALPLQIYVLSLPGIHYLWGVTFLKLMILLLLFPIFMTYISNNYRGERKIILSDLFFLGFVGLKLLLSIRYGIDVGIIRGFIDTLLQWIVPYIVISRFIVNPNMMSWFLSGLLMSAMVISFLAIFESALKWRLFTGILDSLGLIYNPMITIPWGRDGVVRASGGAFLAPLAFAYFNSLAIVICYFFWRNKVIRFFPAMIMMGTLLFAQLLASSRGGQLSLMAGLFMIHYMRFNPWLKLIIQVSAAVIIPVLIVYFTTFGFSAIDSQGTFQYRYQLLLNSMNVVSANLLLGSTDFLNDATLEQSRQGEGIIDVVNLYLQVTLQYGIVGLFLYVASFVSIMRGVASKKNLIGFNHRDLLVALLFMTMVFIATCSDVSYIPWYIVILLAMGRAFVEFPEHQQYKEAMPPPIRNFNNRIA